MGEIELQATARVRYQFGLAVRAFGKFDAPRDRLQITGADGAQRRMGDGEQAAICFEFEFPRASLLVL